MVRRLLSGCGISHFAVLAHLLPSAVSTANGKVRYYSYRAYFILYVGRDGVPPSIGCQKCGSGIFAARGDVGAWTCRLRQKPEGRGRGAGSAGSQRRCRFCRTGWAGRAARPSGSARGAGSAQSDRSRYSAELPGRRLLGVVPRRRSIGERLLRACAQPGDLYRRTASVLRRRSKRGECTFGRDLRGVAAIMQLWRPLCRPWRDAFSPLWPLESAVQMGTRPILFRW